MRSFRSTHHDHGILDGFPYSAVDHNSTSAARLGAMIGELRPGTSPNWPSTRYSIYTLARRQYGLLDQYRYPPGAVLELEDG